MVLDRCRLMPKGYLLELQFVQQLKYIMYEWVTQIWNVGIAIGPVLGYVYQYKLIRQKKSVGTFSINLCGVLLFCNILRVGFYISSRYSMALLVQSLFMILVQIFLLKLCVETMQLQGKFKNIQAELRNEDKNNRFKNFWKWNTINRYYYVVLVFSIAVMAVAWIFNSLDVKIIGQALGFLSLVSESLLMVPQIIENKRQGRIKGLSHLLVGLNFSGDVMKLGFFFVYNQPIQFVICGVLQCIFDALIIIQIVYYRYNPTSQDVMASIQNPIPKNQIKDELNYKELADKAKSETDEKSNDYKQFEDEAK